MSDPTPDPRPLDPDDREPNLAPTPDVWGWRAELLEALAAPELAKLSSDVERSRETVGAAFDVARALGYCRYYGVPLAEFDGALDLPLAHAAVVAVRDVVAEQQSRLDTLDEAYEQAVCPEEEYDLVAGHLHSRMDVHVVSHILDEALQGALERDEPGADLLLDELEQLIEPISAWDDQLQGHAELLSLATDLPLLENWRARGANAENWPIPWWLDGGLEALAAQAVREAQAPLTLAMPEDGARSNLATAGESSDQATRVDAGWMLPAPEAPTLLAATSAAAEVVTRHLHWEAADGASPATPLASPVKGAEVISGLTAAVLSLRVQPPLAADASVFVLFLSGATRALGAEGVLVRLGSLESRIDAQGRAKYRYGDLVADQDSAGREWWRLRVGEPGVEWRLRE